MVDWGTGRRLDDLDRYPVRVWYLLVGCLSLAFAVWFRLTWPSEWIYDDGAIVLRYMDKFAQGGFYQYNLEDPPVFGISGFLHGILAGLLAKSHLLSPKNSLLFSNMVGVGLVSAATMLILRRCSSSGLTVLLAWILTLSAAHLFVTTAFQGLETPLHLGFVLLAFWTYLDRRSRAMWFCFALAVISKLDAAPVVAVLGSLRLAELAAARSGRLIWLREIRNAMVWAGIPLAVWVGFTMWLFGSPMPQTVYAKVVYHGHTESRLAFFREWVRIDDNLNWMHVVVALSLPVLARFRRPVLGVTRVSTLALPFCVLALVVLYSIYNPGERMPWYFVLPQFLLLLSAVIAGLGLLARLTRRSSLVGLATAGVVFAVLVPGYLDRSLKSARYVTTHILRSEPERAAVGAYVREHAAPGDRLCTGHGYTAREAGIYVIDYSGLNSPVVTDLKKQNKGIIGELKPEWSVRPGLWGADFQESNRYELQASFYGRAFDNRACWRIFRRRALDLGPVTVAALLAEDEMSSDDTIRILRDRTNYVEAVEDAEFRYRRSGTVVACRAGVARIAAAQELEIVLIRDGQPQELLVSLTVPARDDEDWGNGRAQELRVPIPSTVPPGSAFDVKITRVGAVNEADKFRLFEPIWMIATGPTGS